MALRPITDFASQILKPYINNQDKAYAANIAPVETSPATSAHTAGTQIIYNGVLYDVTADIAANDALATTGAGANIAAADDVSEQISNVKQALSNLANYDADTGVKNYLMYPYYTNQSSNNEISFKYYDDGGISFEGTTTQNNDYQLTRRLSSLVPHQYLPKGTYIMSMVDKDGNILDSKIQIVAYTTYNGSAKALFLWGTGEQEFTIDDNTLSDYKLENGSVLVAMYVRALSGNTFTHSTRYYPQIRRKDIGSNTIPQPYAKPNTELTKDDIGLTANAFVNGCVNLAPSKFTSQTITSNGANITVEVNPSGYPEGCVKVNGTAGTADVLIAPSTSNKFFLDLTKSYQLSGCPSGGSNSSYRFDLTYVTTSSSGSVKDYGNGALVVPASDWTNSGNAFNFRIFIKAGATVSNLIFKPMLTVADMPNSDYNHYVPYAKSNKELTDDVYSDWNDLAFSNSDYNDGGRGFIKYKKVGNLLFLLIHCEVAANLTVPRNTSNPIAQLPDGYRPQVQFRSNLFGTSGYTGNPNVPIQCTIGTNGNISILTSETDGYTFPITYALYANMVVPC